MTSIPSASIQTTPDPPSARPRYEWIDAWRGIAAVCIVWHHLSLYAPQSDLADLVAPTAMYMVYNHALYAVHVFMVISGFSIAVGDAQTSLTFGAAVQRFAKRFWRLAAPYWVALVLFLLICLVTQQARIDLRLLEDYSWPKLLAHWFFMQDLLGFGNFTAGTWYLCIIVQYYVLVLGLLVLVHAWETHRTVVISAPKAMAAILVPLGALSAWVWNLDTRYDVTVFYFLGQLALGTVLGWVVTSRISHWVLVLCIGLYGASLFAQWRPQLWFALFATSGLWLGVSWMPAWSNPRWLRWLSRISYSLFLVHYAVNGLVLVALDGWASGGAVPAFLSMCIAFACSLLVADRFYAWVESPSQKSFFGLSVRRATTSSLR